MSSPATYRHPTPRAADGPEPTPSDSLGGGPGDGPGVQMAQVLPLFESTPDADTAHVASVEGGVHGDLECADVEAMVADFAATAEAERITAQEMRAELDAALASLATAHADIEHLRIERQRLIALVNTHQAKHGDLADDRDSLAEQVQILAAELDATEEYTLPEDTLLHATITETDLRQAYRAASRVTRGPLPPSIAQAVHEESQAIVTAMQDAAQQVLADVVRRAVRRRRRAQARGRSRTSTASRSR